MANTTSLFTQNKSSDRRSLRARRSQRIFEMVVFAMLGALMFCSKIIMEAIPNVHLLGMLVMVYTVAFRWKALIPIYIYVIINGLWAGFGTWWVPYLYIWTILWALTMLLPRCMPKYAACVVYPLVCALHGFGFGILYAPAQALLYHMSWQGILSWIAAGFYFDMIHGISNLFMGLLVYPLSQLLGRLMRMFSR